MATKRSVDLITDAFSSEMSTRRKYELKNSNGDLIETLYFKPLTRFDRKQAQSAIGTDDALTISTRLLCQLAEKEDGSKVFAIADAENLQRFLPERVLNELELFMMDIQVDIDTAKNE